MSDTQVLKETVTRVESLTENISSLTGEIQQNVGDALRNLRPLAERTQGSHGARGGILQSLHALNAVKGQISAIQLHGDIIQSGLSVAGPQVYGDSWTALDGIYSDLTTNHREFHGLVKQVSNLQQIAESECMAAIHSDFERVFSGDYTKDDLAALQENMAFGNVHNLQKKINVMATTQIRIWATRAVQAHASKIETTAALKKFKAYHSQFMEQSAGLFEEIFAPQQSQDFLGLVDEIFIDEEQQLTKKVGRLSQQKAKSAAQSDMGAIDEIEATMELDPNAPELEEMVGKGAERLQKFFLEATSAAITIDQGMLASERAGRTIREVAKRATTARGILENQPPRYYLPKPAPTWLKGFPLTSQMPDMLDVYFADILESLFDGLQQAAAASKSGKSQQGMFLINNTSFMKHFFASNQLATVVGPLTMARLTKHHNNGVKLYLTDWQRLSQCLMDPTLTNSGKLSGKDREAVKERFRQFNTEFEVLVEKQKRAQIPDKGLRAELSKAIAGIIRPLYKLFYEKHSGGDFTKNLDKYVKYDLQKLDSILSTM